MKYTIASLFVFCAFFAQAQSETSKYSVTLRAANQTPFFDIVFGSLPVNHRPLYPSIGVAVERDYVNGKRARLYQDVSLSYFHDTYTERDWTLASNLGYELRIVKGLYAGVRLGVGVQRANRSDIVYTYETDRWVGKPYPGGVKFRTQIELGGEIGYRIGKNSIFGGYKYSVLTPYDTENGLPIWLLKALTLGIRIGF
ncbi:MAG: hypothetical protein RLZZ292_365 [Bacteroidota bacterium]|jgi:hypothetical protein